MLPIYTISLSQILPEKGKSRFRVLEEYVIKNLKNSIKGLHLQPFYESPKFDNGYDISNYTKIDSEYGSLEDFKELVSTCSRNNILLFIDLVFNHISVNHQWFQNALKGDNTYKEYFIHSKNPPKFLRYQNENEVIYYDDNKIFSNILYIPENINKPNPHWEKYGDDQWYFHSFYKYQIDLNLENENVLKELDEIYKFWTQFDVNFRFDALGAFHGKELIINQPGPNLKLIKSILKRFKNINSKPLFLCEIFITDEILQIPEIDLIYDFLFCEKIWMSHLLCDADILVNYCEKISKNTRTLKKIVGYLRNHDELSLYYYLKEDKDILNNIMKNNTTENISKFASGIAGTTYTLSNLILSENTNLINNLNSFEKSQNFDFIYCLLYSLPINNILIPSGDEFSFKGNDVPENVDKRYINRPIISNKIQKEYSKIFEQLKMFKEKYFINFKQIVSLQKILIKIVYENCVIYFNISREKEINFTFYSIFSKLILSVGDNKIKERKDINHKNFQTTVVMGPKSIAVFHLNKF